MKCRLNRPSGLEFPAKQPGWPVRWKYFPKARIAAVSLLVRVIYSRWARPRAACCAALLWLAICAWAIPSETLAGEAQHAIAMHGAPAWPEDFSRLPYANPTAPKGGRLVQGVLEIGRASCRERG